MLRNIGEQQEGTVYRYALVSGEEFLMALTRFEKADKAAGEPGLLAGIPVTTGDRIFTTDGNPHEGRNISATSALTPDGQSPTMSEGNEATVFVTTIGAVQRVGAVEEFVEGDEALAEAFGVFREVQRLNDRDDVVQTFWANPSVYEPDANEQWTDFDMVEEGEE